MCHGMRDALRARIWCAFTLIPPLTAAVIQLGVVSLDSFGDPAYGDLRDPMQGLHGD
jgi:hypothetical protein